MLFRHLTDEIQLRIPEPQHVSEVHDVVMRNFSALHQVFGWAVASYSLSDTKAFIIENVESYSKGRAFSVNIMVRNELAGNAGFNTFDESNRRTELGYWLSAPFQGKGIMTKVCRFLVNYAFSELHMNRVEIRAATQNVRSSLVAERLGFTREGILHQAEWIHDHYNDLALYAVLASDWKFGESSKSEGKPE